MPTLIHRGLDIDYCFGLVCDQICDKNKNMCKNMFPFFPPVLYSLLQLYSLHERKVL